MIKYLRLGVWQGCRAAGPPDWHSAKLPLGEVQVLVCGDSNGLVGINTHGFFTLLVRRPPEIRLWLEGADGPGLWVKATFTELHGFVARNEALEWGHFRGEGNETGYTPNV